MTKQSDIVRHTVSLQKLARNIKSATETKPRTRTAKPRVTQRHHISYDPEITATIYKGEHEILSKMNMYTKKNLSRGFIRCLKTFIALHEDRATELELEV